MGDAPVSMMLTNQTGNDLEITGVQGKHFDNVQTEAIIPAGGGSGQVATFEDYDYDTSDRSGWVYLQDNGTGAQYQLYIRDKGEFIGPNKQYADFGWFDKDSNGDNPNPKPFPDGCATATWGVAQVDYSLLSTPPSG